MPKDDEKGLDDGPLEIIAQGWFRLGPNPDQMDNPIRQRGWFVYPDPAEGMVPVILVRIKEEPTS